MKLIKMEKTLGIIGHVAQTAIDLAKKEHNDVQFVFNEIALTVSPRSDSNDIALIYNLKRELDRLNPDKAYYRAQALFSNAEC